MVDNGYLRDNWDWSNILGRVQNSYPEIQSYSDA